MAHAVLARTPDAMEDLVERHYIDRPSLLPILEIRNLSLESQTTQSPDHCEVTLALLQPLADPAIFAQCRGSMQRVIMPDGSPAATDTGIEILNIHYLSTAWRKALLETNSAWFGSITFDLTLPSVQIEETDPPVQLSWSCTKGEGFDISDRDILNLVYTLATSMRMRAKTAGLRFSTFYPAEDLMSRAFKTMQERLDAIARYQRPKLDTDTLEQSN